MRKLSIFIIMLCLLFYAGTASAQAVGAWNAFGASDLDLALPGRDGKRVCVTYLYSVDGTGSSDIDFYGSSGDRAMISTDVAAGETVLASVTGSTASGVGTTAHVVIQRASGVVAEYGKLASFTSLAPTLADVSTTAFKRGDYIYEMDVLLHSYDNHSNVAANFSNDRGLFCGPPNSPLLALAGTGSWIEGMFGYYVENDFTHPRGAPAGTWNGLAASGVNTMLALPGVEGQRLVITGFGADLNAADDDINWYTWTGLQTDQARLSADEVAGQTAITAIADPGFADTSAYVFFERADGTYGELSLMSAYTAGGGVDAITTEALENGYFENDTIRLAEVLRISDDSIETIIAISNPYGLFTAPVGYPVGMVSEETDGKLNYLIGYYEDANAKRRTLANYTADDTATSTVAGSLSISLPGFPGKRTCVTSITIDPTTGGSDDVWFYTATQPRQSTKLTADLSAAGTAITWVSEQGADNIGDVYVVLQSPDGDRSDLVLMSAASETSGTATAAHVTQAYPKGSTVTEMENLPTSWILLNGVGNDAKTLSHPEGLFCGPIGSPIGARLDGSDSQVEQISGYAE